MTEEEVKIWCKNNGWSQPVFWQGTYYAVPPGGVMTEPVPFYLETIKQQNNRLKIRRLFRFFTPHLLLAIVCSTLSYLILTSKLYPPEKSKLFFIINLGSASAVILILILAKIKNYSTSKNIILSLAILAANIGIASTKSIYQAFFAGQSLEIGILQITFAAIFLVISSVIAFLLFFDLDF